MSRHVVDLLHRFRDAKMIYVLTIEHKHGHDTWAHRTPEGARASLLNYAIEYWASEVGDAPKPIDPDALIQQYFEATNGQEWWSIDQVEVLP